MVAATLVAKPPNAPMVRALRSNLDIQTAKGRRTAALTHGGKLGSWRKVGDDYDMKRRALSVGTIGNLIPMSFGEGWNSRALTRIKPVNPLFARPSIEMHNRRGLTVVPSPVYGDPYFWGAKQSGANVGSPM
jgi:hypothetical protein